MLAVALIGFLCTQSVLPEVLADFLAVYVLLDGFEHGPVGRTAALLGKGWDAAFQGLVYLQEVAILPRYSKVSLGNNGATSPLLEERPWATEQGIHALPPKVTGRIKGANCERPSENEGHHCQ
jgi:hypothetical protein